ncbi:MAG: C4-type zinc ribbon domain-containing protein [Anaerolineales bacterium]|nr:C4-type zinc ribbon domain-containing protein [Anaerolineales bacterium]
MSASLGIYRLQQVDRQMDRASAQLDTIRITLENDTELRSALERAETTQTHNQHSLHEMKNTEADVDSQKIKIEQAESSLYGGTVKNPKELQDLQKDVASLKKYLVTLEERQFEAMLKAETSEADLKIARTELKKIQARLGSEHGKLIEEQSTLATQLERLTDERQAALAPIESNLLQTYEALRQQKRGVAVAEINDNACVSCGTTLNASIQQNARSQKQLVNCPSCGRILFAN